MRIRLVDSLFLPGWRGRNVLDHDHSYNGETADSLLRMGYDLCGKRVEILHHRRIVEIAHQRSPASVSLGSISQITGRISDDLMFAEGRSFT